MKIKVSVILPSLNVIQYIKECVESVLNQTLREIEVICVDAGSEDGTLEVLREYEKEDDRVKVIVSDKKSYGYQMNIGMKVAQGEYIGIVETDDYISEEMYAELYKVAKENEVDFVKADFYRFSGSGKEIHKALNRLSKDVNSYNRIISPREEQECFSFIMNTWSGIYKRDFLKKNNIRHNESLGASYQDNGFWFQTFLFAQKVYFVNKPYYMNRRDNPCSSVYSRDKVSCIFGEYDYILNVLQGNNDLFKTFSEVYVKTCYRAFRGHLNRVAAEYRVTFLERFAIEFEKLRCMGMLQESFLETDEGKFVCEIMNDPTGYYDNIQRLRSEIYENIISHENIIIYGAGMVGKRVFHDLSLLGKAERVVCFAVSDVQENLNEIEGIPVRAIADLKGEKSNYFIVVAVTRDYQKEIQDILEQGGFEHVFCVPDYIYT